MIPEAPLPKQHGAWALLYGPFVLTIAVLGRFEFRILVLFVAISALFVAHEPLSKLVRSSRHGVPRSRALYWKRWLLVYLATALGSGFYLVWQYRLWSLLPLGLLIALLLVLHLYLVGQRQEKHVWGELIGVVGLTATGPATYYVLESRWNEPCFLLWFLTLLYFSSGIFYVKMRVSRFIKTDERGKRIVHCILYHLFLCVSLLLLNLYDLIPKLLILAYVPMIVRACVGALAKEERLNIRKIGFTELAHTIAFIVLFVIFWKL